MPHLPFWPTQCTGSRRNPPCHGDIDLIQCWAYPVSVTCWLFPFWCPAIHRLLPCSFWRHFAVIAVITYIPESILATWLRRAVGPAVGIGAMVKCGLTHPPAGAHAVLYASGKYNFGFYALVVLSTIISVIPATVVNNLSIKRQYPTYWGFIPTWLYVKLKRLWSSLSTENKAGSERTSEDDSNE